MTNSGWLRGARLAVVLTVASLGLSGCFDLTQDVAISRDGSGHYRIALTAQGIIGEGLKNASIVDTKHNHAELATTNANGKVTRTALVKFHSLNDLALSSEAMSLTVTGHDFFGLGPAHVAFRDTFHVDQAKKESAQTGEDSGMGRQIAQSILGDHSYVFSVTVPGSIEHIAPVVIGSDIVQPTVTGDFYHGHTVTWHMPLADLIDAKALRFEVDFVAYGLFGDAQTKRPAQD
jgi:hypothetical protein